jgi:hypothetical protein
MNLKRIILSLTMAAAFVLAALVPAAAADSTMAGGDDQVTFGGNIMIPAGQTHQGDLVAFGGNIEVDGTVTQDLVAFGGNVVVNGRVDRDVAVVGGSLTLGPESYVGRDVSFAGGSLTRMPGSYIGRNIVEGRGGQLDPRAFRHLGPIFTPRADFPGIVFGLVTGLGILVLALIILLFFPTQLQTTASVIERRPVETFALGCGGTIAAVVLMVLLVITLVLPFVVAGAMTVAWLFGWAAIFLLIGQRLLQTMDRPQELVPALLVGGLLVVILANIPLLNVLVLLIGGSVALGAALLSRFGTQGPAAPLVPALPANTPPPPAAPTPPPPAPAAG